MSDTPFPYTLDLLARVSVPLAKVPEVIGRTPEGLHVDFNLMQGTVVGPKLNGAVLGEGADHMMIRTDGVGILDVDATVQVDGGMILMRYSGVFDWGPNGYTGFMAHQFPANPLLRVTPNFLVPDTLPDLQWLNRVQCVGMGSVTPNAEGQFVVAYDLYAVN